MMLKNSKVIKVCRTALKALCGAFPDHKFMIVSIACDGAVEDAPSVITVHHGYDMTEGDTVSVMAAIIRRKDEAQAKEN